MHRRLIVRSPRYSLFRMFPPPGLRSYGNLRYGYRLGHGVSTVYGKLRKGGEGGVNKRRLPCLCRLRCTYSSRIHAPMPYGAVRRPSPIGLGHR